MKNGKNTVILFLLILSAIIVGGFLGEFFKGNALLSFLGQGFNIGVNPPVVVDLRMLKFTLGIILNINIASVTAIILAIYIYTKL